VFHQLTLGEPDLQFDLTARLLEQAVALGGRKGRDSRFFGRDFLGAAVAERVNFARQRL
jgi:hypothetical protein